MNVAFFIFLAFVIATVSVYYFNNRLQKEYLQKTMSVELNPRFSLDEHGHLLLDKQRLHDTKGSVYADEIQEIFFTSDGDVFVQKLTSAGGKDEIAWEHYIDCAKTEVLSEQAMNVIVCLRGAFSASDFYLFETDGREVVTIIFKRQ